MANSKPVAQLRNSNLQLNNFSGAAKVVREKVIFVSNGTMYLYGYKHKVKLLNSSHKLLIKYWTMVNLRPVTIKFTPLV